MAVRQQTMGQWLVRTLGGGLVVALVSLSLAALAFHFKEEIALEAQRLESLQDLSGQRRQTLQARERVLQRIEALRLEEGSERERLTQAERMERNLRPLVNWWDRWIADRERQAFYRQQLSRMDQVRVSAKRRLAAIEQDLKLETYTLEGLELALGKVDLGLAEVDKMESKVLRFAKQVWQEAAGYVLATVALWLFGPLLIKAVLYYLFAPWVQRGEALFLGGRETARPSLGAKGVNLEVILGPGQTAYVKEAFLQASDEGARKKTRWLLDWRLPMTSYASGLVEMLELRPPPEGGPLALVLASSQDTGLELAEFHLPEGASLILRPRFVIALQAETGQRVKVRRRWVFWTWQAWTSFQFRHFQFLGPCRLVVAASRGVRVEHLQKAQALERRYPSRRVNRQAVIGFEPSLGYRPKRAETFWSYYRGMNGLFDDCFEGEGLFLCQASSLEKTAGRNGWRALWDLALKAVGV